MMMLPSKEVTIFRAVSRGGLFEGRYYRPGYIEVILGYSNVALSLGMWYLILHTHEQIEPWIRQQKNTWQGYLNEW
jgi:hypothetical protein